MALASPLFRAVTALLPTSSIADMGPGSVLDSAKAAWPGATFVTYTVGGRAWTIRFDSGSPPSQADIDAALASNP